MAVILYGLLFAVAVVPGLPLGFALFGRRHAGGWIVGAALGYVVTALAIWVPLHLGAPGPLAFAISWSVAVALTWLVTRGLPSPLVTVPPWTRRELAALASVWLVTLVIAVPPFARAGATDAQGNRYYRAYFTADFVWHTALTAEVMKGASPPRNPYLANRPIHYYWTYFLIPAAAADAGVRALTDVELCLKVNGVAVALLFVSSIYLCAWTAVPRAWAVAAAVGLAIVASSAEGSFALWRLWDRGRPLAGVKDLNIDAISAWWFNGLRVDGLQRCFWWVPQHSMAYTLGLCALAIVNAAGSASPLAAIVLAGVALAGSATMNPLVGGVFCLAWGAAVLADAARSGQLVTRALRHAIAVAPVVLALAWCIANQMVEGAGGALEIGWHGAATHAPLAMLLLSLGPALIPGIAGAAARSGTRVAIGPCVLAVLALLMMYFVRLRVDQSWVGFRAGQLFLAAVPALIARGFAAPRPWRAAAIAVALACLLAGLPTTIIDAYNAQDISNVSESPIGPWTIAVTAREHDAHEWLRRATPATSIVQMDPLARGRSTWSLIPSFAQRRMAAGLPISLLDVPEYHDKTARVQTMYATADAALAHDIARSLRIDYIYVDRVERAAYASGMPKFDAAPRFFAPAYRNEEVSIYRVQ